MTPYPKRTESRHLYPKIVPFISIFFSGWHTWAPTNWLGIMISLLMRYHLKCIPHLLYRFLLTCDYRLIYHFVYRQMSRPLGHWKNITVLWYSTNNFLRDIPYHQILHMIISCNNSHRHMTAISFWACDSLQSKYRFSMDMMSRTTQSIPLLHLRLASPATLHAVTYFCFLL